MSMKEREGRMAMKENKGREEESGEGEWERGSKREGVEQKCERKRVRGWKERVGGANGWEREGVREGWTKRREGERKEGAIEGESEGSGGMEGLLPDSGFLCI